MRSVNGYSPENTILSFLMEREVYAIKGRRISAQRLDETAKRIGAELALFMLRESGLLVAAGYDNSRIASTMNEPTLTPSNFAYDLFMMHCE